MRRPQNGDYTTATEGGATGRISALWHCLAREGSDGSENQFHIIRELCTKVEIDDGESQPLDSSK